MSAVGPIGVLALQGGFSAHRRLLAGAGCASREVRSRADLDGISGLLLPGGESTTIAKGLDREGLADPIAELSRQGLPILGTCAGMVLMGRETLGLIDMDVERNAFGRQVHSFERDLEIPAVGEPAVRGVFIRAPVATDLGAGVEVICQLEGRPVAVREGNRVAISFHPELIGDARLHLLALGLTARDSVRSL